MMYDEFINRLPEGTRHPTASEYKEIELVYACHPSISGSGHRDRSRSHGCTANSVCVSFAT